MVIAYRAYRFDQNGRLSSLKHLVPINRRKVLTIVGLLQHLAPVFDICPAAFFWTKRYLSIRFNTLNHLIVCHFKYNELLNLSE